MALLDIFKKKEPEEKKGKKYKKAGREVKKPAPVKIKESKESKPAGKKDEFIKIEPAQKKKDFENAYRILVSPHVTEKATMLTEENKYIFEVWPRANKGEVKNAVEGVYGVKVTAVNIINIPSKQRLIKGKIGWKKGYKKAIVTVKEGQKIEILPR